MILCTLCGEQPVDPVKSPGGGCDLCAMRRLAPGADEAVEQAIGAWLKARAEAADERLREACKR